MPRQNGSLPFFYYCVNRHAPPFSYTLLFHLIFLAIRKQRGVRLCMLNVSLYIVYTVHGTAKYVVYHAPRVRGSLEKPALF